MGDQLYLGLPSRGLEIALRLPPLYMMDSILMQDLSLTAPIFQESGAAGAPAASLAATSTLTTDDGQRIRVTEAPQGANFSATLEAAAQAQAEGSRAWEEVYTRLYGGSADAAVLPYYLLNLLLGTLAYAGAALVLTLSLRQLLVLYGYLIAVLCLPLSYASHGILTETLSQLEAAEQAGADPANAEWFLHRMLSSSSLISSLALDKRAILANYLVQTSVSLVLSSLLSVHFDNREFVSKAVTFSMLSPNLLAIVGVPTHVLELSSLLSLALPTLLMLWIFYSVGGQALRSLTSTFRRKRQLVLNFGLSVFLETEWARLRVPSLLRTFWVTRVGLQLVTECLSLYQVSLWPSAVLPAMALPALAEAAASLARRLATRGSETIIAVLGMTSVVSSVCHHVGSFFHAVLTAGVDGGSAGEDADEKSVASVSAVLFFVLALQTGLTSLEPDKRFVRLCKNLCLLLTALFHFIHNMVSPVLMSLSAGRNYNSRRRHARALFICAFLVLAPVALMVHLWQAFPVGTWLLAVSAFCVEVIVKVAVTVSVYLLFLYDQIYQDGMWEMLDDAVYYVKATGNSVEFCFAVFLFFNGGWILVFESGGTIRAFMMLIHAYCNIWLEAKAGWQTFMKRRTAVAKINSLPDATRDQLESHNDVCAICYQEMTSTAKVTRCRHYFHGVCLRKWLYVQDSCPLCYGELYNKTTLDTDGGNNNDGGDDNAEAEQQQQQPQQHRHPRPHQSHQQRRREEEVIDNDDNSTASSSSSTTSSVSTSSSSSYSAVSLAARDSSFERIDFVEDQDRTEDEEEDGELLASSGLDEDDLIYDSLDDDDDNGGEEEVAVAEVQPDAVDVGRR